MEHILDTAATFIETIKEKISPSPEPQQHGVDTAMHRIKHMRNQCDCTEYGQ